MMSTGIFKWEDKLDHTTRMKAKMITMVNVSTERNQ